MFNGKNTNTGYLESFVYGDLKVGKFRHLIKFMMLSSVSIQRQCNFLNLIKKHSHIYLNQNLFLLYNLFFLVVNLDLTVLL